jgi:hypothetical protein
MIDIFIAFSAISLFIFFVFFHILVLRLTKHKGVLKWTFNSLVISCLSGILLILVLNFAGLIGKIDVLPSMFLTLLIFASFAAFYVFAVFGITTTSIRIRLLRILYNVKDKRLTLDELLRKYNLDIMMSESLKKLLESGEIGFRNGKYYFIDKPSYFNIHNIILVFYRNLLN